MGAESQDGSRAALRRKAAIDKELSGLTAQCDSLRADESELAMVSDRLAAKVEAFRVRSGISALPYPRQRELLT